MEFVDFLIPRTVCIEWADTDKADLATTVCLRQLAYSV